MSIIEQEILKLLVEGDLEAFNAIYKRYHQQVYTNIYKLVKDPYYAQEILQDVFVALWENSAKLDREKSIVGWLFVVSYNKSLDFLKKKLRESVDFIPEYHHAELSDSEDVLEEHIYNQRIDILHDAVQILPRRKQQVFTLLRLEGKSKQDVAQQLGLTLLTVNDYLKQATKTIRDYIAAHYSSEINPKS